MAHTCAQRPLMAACLSQPRSAAAAAACVQAVASGIDLWVPLSLPPPLFPGPAPSSYSRLSSESTSEKPSQTTAVRMSSSCHFVCLSCFIFLHSSCYILIN